jgi:citrate lyase beta subunit
VDPTLTASDLTPFIADLATTNAETARRFPGGDGRRQPVHTVYGGAQIFRRDTASRLGAVARATFDQYGVDAATFGAALGLPLALGATVYDRVREKLEREPVEDFRIDFEDGYGNRPDAEEDADAVRTGEEVAAGLWESSLPPFIGIRVKPLSEDLKARSLRTLDLFITTVATRTGGQLPPHFVVTLPKITSPGQVATFTAVLARLEADLGLADPLRFELMIETTQSIFDRAGRIALGDLVAAGDGRCVAAHFGTYDYTAACDITAAYQHMTHPACDFARHVMQVALGGTGIWLSDGATNVLPVAPHRAAPDGPPLSAAQEEENRRSVHDAWRLHYGHVRHSLEHAFYQGWDLHPAHLPTRYAAVYAFFLEGIDAAAERLSNFVGKAAQATLVGDVFDDAATGQGLLNYFLRAVNCGAISEEHAVERTGLTLDEIRGRSFLSILAARRG